MLCKYQLLILTKNLFRQEERSTEVGLLEWLIVLSKQFPFEEIRCHFKLHRFIFFEKNIHIKMSNITQASTCKWNIDVICLHCLRGIVGGLEIQLPFLPLSLPQKACIMYGVYFHTYQVEAKYSSPFLLRL